MDLKRLEEDRKVFARLEALYDKLYRTPEEVQELINLYNVYHVKNKDIRDYLKRQKG